MPRRVFYDCEFNDNGSTVELISIGAIDEQGHEFYAISTDFDPEACNPWVKENVLPLLPSRSAGYPWMSRTMIARQLSAYLLATPLRRLELWAYYGAYDHVALAQLWGAMIQLPSGVPMFTHELMQLWESSGRPEKPAQPKGEHNALADAKWDRELFWSCVR
jgi:hypothetical protein